MSENNKSKKIRSYLLVILLLVAAGGLGEIIWRMPAGGAVFSSTPAATSSVASAVTTLPVTVLPAPFAVTHIPTPSAVRAVYFTSWAAGTPSFQKQLFALFAATTTQLNAIVIDIKDYSGRIGYTVTDPRFKDPTIDAMGSAQNRIPDIEQFVASLHAKGIYVIGRVQSFEDPFAVTVHPDWAVKTASGALWKDSGGANWIDPDNQNAWNYIAAIAKQGYGVGFDEINFDYVRFPSDGIGNAVFAKSASTTKESVITSFFAYLHSQFAPLGIPISADVFGQTTSDPGDMGIGQHFENVLPYFNFVDPMVYPSHYINGFDNFANPAEHPYAMIKFAMDSAVGRAIAASSSPAEIRPWLQGFDLGAVYTPAMLEDQMQASADAGLGSWLVWNAASVYTRYESVLDGPISVVAPIVPPVSKIAATSTVSTTAAPLLVQ
jgi:hypothetical protein